MAPVSVRIYDGGLVVEEWDDDTRTYRWLNDEGAWQARTYHDGEAAPQVARVQEAAHQIVADLLR